MSNLALRVPPALPARIDDWKRFLKTDRTINDYVEDVHRELIEGEHAEKYLLFLTAVYDEQAIEGSLSADNYQAAQMIRDHARDKEYHGLANQKLATIVKALNVVLRRYHASRQERRQMVAGDIVPNGAGE